MAQAGTVWVDVRGDTKGFLADVSSAARRAGSAFSPLNVGKTVLSDIGQVAGVTALAIGGIGAAAIKTSAEFDAGMSAVGAVANASEQQIHQLREAALRAGADSVFTATEAAEAQAELARAGVSVADILGGALTGALDLAAAGQVGLADAAIIAAQAMNIFDLEGSQVSHVADVLAAGANKSAADIADLGFALRQGGLAAAQMGTGIEETVGVLSLFSDNALIGSDAGTSFRVMMQRLVPQTDKAAGAMEDLGLTFFDSNGEFVGLEETAGRLQAALSDLTDEERTLTLVKLFGTDAFRAANILYEAGAEGVREYTQAVNDQGAAERVAAQNLDNLKGDIEEFSGATETALIRVGDLMDGVNRSAVQSATGFVDVFNEWAQMPAWKAVQRNIDDLARTSGSLFDDLGDRLSDALSGVSPRDVDRAFRAISSGVSDARQAIDGLEPVVAGLGIAFGTMAARSVPFIGQLVPAISPVTGLLGGLVLGSEEGRDALASLGEKASELARKVGPDLSGALADLAGELSDGLAVVLEDVGGAAIDAAEVLGPVLGDAISELAPVLGDLTEAGAELVSAVLPPLARFAGDVLPPAVDLLGAGLSVAADAAQLLADNAWILVPALGAVAAVKIAPALGAATRSITDFSAAVGQIAATRGVSQMTALGGVVRSTGREVGSLAAGLVGALNPAVLGVTAAITLGTIAYGRYAENKSRVEDITTDLVDALGEERSKFNELNTERARQTFADKEALDVQNQLGRSLADLTDIAATHGGELRRLDEIWRQVSFQTDQFRNHIETLPGPVREIGEAIADMVDADVIDAGEAKRFFEALDELAQGTAGSMRQAREEFESLAREAAASGEITAQDLDRVLKLLREAETPRELNQAFQVLGDMLGIVGDEAAAAESELRRLQDRMEEFLGIERDAAEMSRRFNEALDRTTEAFFRNGKGIDETTEAGRANADAIDNMVTSAERLAEQLAKTDATGAASGRVFNKLTLDLKALYDQNLLNEEEYRGLLDLYGLTPDEIDTRINVWTGRAKADLEDLRQDILDTPGVTEAEEALIRAINDPVALARVGSEIAAVARDRVATVRLQVREITPTFGITTGTGVPLPVFGKRNVKGGRASGGPVWPGTWIVGEDGPEVLEIGPGVSGHVTNARDTAELFAGGEGNDALIEELRAMREELRRLAARPTIGQLHQHGVAAETAPEDLVVALRKSNHLVGAA